MERDKIEVLKEALAEYLECEAEDIYTILLCTERKGPEEGTIAFSTVRHGLSLHYALGCLDNHRHHIEQERAREAMEALISQASDDESV